MPKVGGITREDPSTGRARRRSGLRRLRRRGTGATASTPGFLQARKEVVGSLVATAGIISQSAFPGFNGNGTCQRIGLTIFSSASTRQIFVQSARRPSPLWWRPGRSEGSGGLLRHRAAPAPGLIDSRPDRACAPPGHGSTAKVDRHFPTRRSRFPESQRFMLHRLGHGDWCLHPTRKVMSGRVNMEAPQALVADDSTIIERRWRAGVLRQMDTSPSRAKNRLHWCLFDTQTLNARSIGRSIPRGRCPETSVPAGPVLRLDTVLEFRVLMLLIHQQKGPEVDSS